MVGNFLNGTNFQGGAFGIRIGSINKLVDTRASTNNTTLLHFLCTMVEEKFPNISTRLVKDLELCGEACRGAFIYKNNMIQYGSQNTMQLPYRILSKTIMSFVSAFNLSSTSWNVIMGLIMRLKKEIILHLSCTSSETVP